MYAHTEKEPTTITNHTNDSTIYAFVKRGTQREREGGTLLLTIDSNAVDSLGMCCAKGRVLL